MFPDQCKIAKLKPLFKKGSKRDPKNYRLISLLPVISKIIEKTIQIQIQEYLDKHGLLYKYQSGFGANFSTDYCFVQLTNFILRGMDKGLQTGMILVDLQKAFDTLYHTVRLKKWNALVLRSQSLNRFNHISQTESFL